MEIHPLPLIAALAGVGWLSARRSGRTVFTRLRLTRIIHYEGMAFGGLAIAWRLSGFQLFQNPSDYLVIPVLGLVAFFAFQAAVGLNDQYDLELDKVSGMRTPLTTGLITLEESRWLTLVTLLISLLFGLSLGLPCGCWVLGFHILSFIYSAPPLRLKRFYPLSTVLIASWALFLMLAGFSVWAGWEDLGAFPPRMAALVVATLSLAFGTKDLKDVEGDRKGGVRTLFTLFGVELGRRINGGLVVGAYLLAPLILDYPGLYMASIPCGILSGWMGLRRDFNETLIFLIYYLFGLTVLGLILTGELFG